MYESYMESKFTFQISSFFVFVQDLFHSSRFSCLKTKIESYAISSFPNEHIFSQIMATSKKSHNVNKSAT